MYKYLFRQSFRASIIQIRNYFVVILGLIIISVIFLESVIRAIYSSSFSLSDNLLMVSVIMSVAQLFILLFRKLLVFFLPPAAIHFFFNSNKINCFKTALFVKKIITNVIISFLLCLIIFNFKLSVNLCAATFILWAYFMMGSFIRWFKYARHKFAIITTFYLCSSILFVLSFASIITIAGVPLFILLAFIVYYNGKVKIDWGKYYDDSVYANKIDTSARHRNMAEMQQINTEHIAKKKHSIRIYHLPLNKNNALLGKALIETFRMSKQVMVVLGILLVFTVLLNKTSIFSGIPLIGDPNISYVFCMFSIGTFLVNLREIYSKQILSICDKHEKGFFIPYTFKKIVSSYAIVCCFVTTLILVILCFIFLPGLIKSIIVLITLNLAMILSFLMQSKKRVTKLVNIIINLIFVIGSRFLL